MFPGPYGAEQAEWALRRFSPSVSALLLNLSVDLRCSTVPQISAQNMKPSFHH